MRFFENHAPRALPLCRLAGRPAARRAAGLTLVELALALGILTVAVGSLVQILSSVNVGQKELSGRQEAYQRARIIAEKVIECADDWQALCSQYDALSDVSVTVQDGDGNPASGWHRITVRVQFPLWSHAGTGKGEAKLVFGKAEN